MTVYSFRADQLGEARIVAHRVEVGILAGEVANTGRVVDRELQVLERLVGLAGERGEAGQVVVEADELWMLREALAKHGRGLCVAAGPVVLHCGRVVLPTLLPGLHRVRLPRLAAEREDDRAGLLGDGSALALRIGD